MASGVKAGKAWVEIHGDNNPLSRALNAAGKKLKHWGANVTKIGLATAAAGTAVLGPILAATKAFANAGDALHKMAARTGTSAEFLSALGYAANLGGTDIDTCEKAIRRLQRAAYEASTGTESYAEAFDVLGVSATAADGQLKDTETLFRDTVAALSRLENETQKAALAQELFGRSGTALLPMLSEGEKGFNAAMAEAKQLGHVIGGEDTKAAAALTDAWARVTLGAKRLYVQIGSALAPTLTVLFNRIAPLVAKTIDWIGQNKALITTVAATATGLVAAGGGLIVLGATLSAAGTVAGTFAATIGIVKLGLLALASPIGLTVAGLAGLTAYAVHSAGGVKAVFANLAESLAPLTEIFTASLGAMKDALAAGDFSLAAKVLWSSLKVAWLTGTADLTARWRSFTADTSRAWAELWTGMRIGAAEAVYAIKKTWQSLSKAGMDIHDTMYSKLAESFAWWHAKATGADAQLAMRIVREDHARRMKKRDKGAAGDRAALDAEHRAATEALGSEHAGTMGVIDAMETEAARAAERSLATAREEWNAALSEAKAAGDAARSPDLSVDGPAIETDPNKIRAASGSVRGTFSAAAVAGLGATDDARRTAEATAATAKNTKILIDRLAALSPAWD
jgi:hypothetical protein